MAKTFSKKMYWLIPLALIGIIVVSLMIISVYYPIKEEQKLVSGKGWVKTLGGPDIHLVSLMHSPVQQTSDGGYVAVGENIYDLIRSADGQILDYRYRVYLVKVDANGNQWNKTYGVGVGFSVQQTSDGGYIIVVEGDRKTKGYLIKTDADGNMQWNKTFVVCKGLYPDRGYSIQQTNDGGYIIAGESPNCDLGGSNADDGFLLKVDANGNKIWETAVGGNEGDRLFSAYQTSDGGYIAFGHTNSFSEKTLLLPESSNVSYYPSEFWVIKTDANGNMILNRTFGEYYYETGYLVDQTSDRGYVVSRDSHVFKFDENGNKLWNKTIDLWKWPRLTKEEAKSGKKQGAEAKFQELLDANYQTPPHQTSDGGFVLVATKGTEDHQKIIFYLVKFDENGNKIQYNKIFVEDVPMQGSIQQTADGGYVISGLLDTIVTNGVAYFYLIKTDENGNV